MKYPNCRKELQPNWRTCPSCGTEIFQPLKCPGCNRTLKAARKSCPYCGGVIIRSKVPSVSIKDSVVKELNQTQEANVHEAKGANVGGNINIHVIGNPSESKQAMAVSTMLR